MGRLARAGSITLVLVGTLSVMVILVFALSKRLQRTTTLLTLVDTTQIARNVLESYAGDLLRFSRLEANKPGSKLYDKLRQGGTRRETFSASSIGYQPTPLLRDLVKEYDGDDRFRLKLVEDPKIALAELKELKLPPMLGYVHEDVAPKEWEGAFEITCEVQFAEKKYALTVSHPYKVVFTMVPLVREFAWFFDQLSVEQPDPFGNDGINLMRIRDDQIVEGGQWPLILDTLASNLVNDKLYTDPLQTGRVFFGRDGEPIYLNLAGENLPEEAPMSDLWMVKRSHFGIGRPPPGATPPPPPPAGAEQPEEADNMQLVKMDALSTANKAVRLRGAVLDLNAPGSLSQGSIVIKMFGVGMSDELVDSGVGFFSADSNWTLDDFLGVDPTWSGPMGRNPKRLQYSSVLKPLGLSRDPAIAADIAKNPALAGADFGEVAGSSPLPRRQIFGHVFRRFVVLSFYSSPSLQGYMQELVYSDNPNFHQTLDLMKTDGTRDQIDLTRAGCTYQQVMSRIVSGGGLGKGTAAFPNSYQTYDVTPGHDLNQPLTAKDFKGSDGLIFKSTDGFSAFGEKYLKFERAAGTAPVWRAARDPVPTLQSRVTRYFADGRRFIEAVKTGGVVFVDRGLDLSKEADVAALPGGVVIVNGPLKLASMRRGIAKMARTDPNLIKAVQDGAKQLKPTDIVTFVVLGGQPITLTGDFYLGVQLVSLYDGPTPLTLPTQPFLFIGGLALSRPSLRHLVGRLPKQSLFFYPPAMATDKPPLTADLDLSMKSYHLRIE